MGGGLVGGLGLGHGLGDGRDDRLRAGLWDGGDLRYRHRLNPGLRHRSRLGRWLRHHPWLGLRRWLGLWRCLGLWPGSQANSLAWLLFWLHGAALAGQRALRELLAHVAAELAQAVILDLAAVVPLLRVFQLARCPQERVTHGRAVRGVAGRVHRTQLTEAVILELAAARSMLGILLFAQVSQVRATAIR